jgi:adenylosuccinate lyase
VDDGRTRTETAATREQLDRPHAVLLDALVDLALEALLADERTGLSAEELDPLLDPTGYLGAAEMLVDRALGEYGVVRG